MTEPLLTHREKRTLLKAGIGVGALVWLGPKVLFVLAMALALAVYAGLFLFLAVGALVKYGAIAAGVLLALALIFRLVRGTPLGSPGRSPAVTAKEVDLLARMTDIEAEYDARERASRAALDVELAKAVRAAETKRARPTA